VATVKNDAANPRLKRVRYSSDGAQDLTAPTSPIVVQTTAIINITNVKPPPRGVWRSFIHNSYSSIHKFIEKGWPILVSIVHILEPIFPHTFVKKDIARRTGFGFKEAVMAF